MAERIEGGVKITCPDSEAVVYDGAAGATGTAGADGADGKDGAAGEAGATGPAGQDGTSCSVSGNGLVSCTDGTQYQLPTATEADGCQIFVLPNTAQ